MYVAKSYTDWERISEPYEVSGRRYIKVRSPSGAEKQVRLYSQKEYDKMYGAKPASEIAGSSSCDTLNRRTQKQILGFEKGYITIFKGITEDIEYWFERSNARYCRYWGWYVVSTEEVPEVPVGIIPIQLNWNLVGTDSGILKPESAIAKAIESLLYEPTTSKFQGSIGERIDIEIEVIKNIPLEGTYGHSNMMIMQDANENVYVWTTAAQNWPVGTKKKIRGTIKDHRIYKGAKQTILTRCSEVK